MWVLYFCWVQLESRRTQAGERLNRQHRLSVGRPDWRLRPEVPLPVPHPQAAVPSQRHVSVSSSISTQQDRTFVVLTKRCVCFRDKVLVCPMKSAPVLLTLSDSKHVVLPVDDDSDLNVVAAFDRRGEYIYTGNAKGKVGKVLGH